MEDIVKLEDMIIEDQRLHFSVPEYHHTWFPKYHWQLHTPLDILRFGPPRFLWVMLMEMKNAHFKRGCKRSNMHNPTKSTALFWVEQSAHILKKQRKAGFCDPSGARVLDKTRLSHLVELGDIAGSALSEVFIEDEEVLFLDKIKFHGACVAQESCLFLGSMCKVYSVLSLISVVGTHFLWLGEIGEATCDAYGSWSLPAGQDEAPTQMYKLLELTPTTQLTPLWSTTNLGRLRFIERW